MQATQMTSANNKENLKAKESSSFFLIIRDRCQGVRVATKNG